MRHPDDRLYDYAVGDLPTDQADEVERHLAQCADCRREVDRMREALVAVVDGLEPVAPPVSAWAAIERRIHERAAPAPVIPAPGAASAAPAAPTASPPRSSTPWVGFALAASLLLAVFSTTWAVVQQRSVAALRTEQQALRDEQQALRDEQSLIARWLSREDVRAVAMPADSTPDLGSVLFQAEGSALVVLGEPAPFGRNYQVWGQLPDGSVESLGVTDGRALEVSSDGYTGIAISLEPEGGSESPTEVLGGVPVL